MPKSASDLVKLIFLTASVLPAQTLPVDLVNPMIGTAGDGQTYPSAGTPFGMTQWAPQTRAGEIKCIAPYYAADTRIQGFRGTHFLTGSCTQDYGSVTLMPLLSPGHLDAESRASAFDHRSEVTHPYLYEVDLRDTGIHAALTGTDRSGLMRFTYPPGHPAWIAIENNSRKSAGFIHIDVEKQEITGANVVHRIYTGNGKPAGFSGYFVIRFDHTFKLGGTFSGANRQPGSTENAAPEGPPGAFISFDLAADSNLEAKIGTSFTSLEEARKNLEAEIPSWDFNAVAAQAKAAWSHELDRIEIPGSSPDRAIFYTALYHSMLLPRIFSDRDGSYPRFAGGQAIEHAAGFTYYDDYSAWDTFRALHPMLTILDPARELDMVKSLIAKGEQGGFLPIFPAWNSYTSEMVGDHSDAIIADAYAKGIRDFDVQSAYRLMKKNATETPNKELYHDGRGRRALDSYLKYGYIPLEDHVLDAFHTNEQVSRTLEYAYDDFLVSEMAAWLGHAEDAKLFAVHSQNYRNVIDPSVGFARGRHADGSWDTPFDPAGKYTYITEGLPFQYTFFVPQDIPGLIQTLQGPAVFVAKLDRLFAGNFYDHGNEPSHHIAYLYDYAGAPAKTQLHVHDIMQKQYRNANDGLAGNDDAGQMSAWYVMSALGIYSVTPGTPQYAIGTPHFDHAIIHLPNGRTLTVDAPGAESGRFYIRSIRLNGKPLGRSYILHSEIEAGGTLNFEMSATPTS